MYHEHGQFIVSYGVLYNHYPENFTLKKSVLQHSEYFLGKITVSDEAENMIYLFFFLSLPLNWIRQHETLGSTVLQRLALSPHSKNVMGSLWVL